MVPSDRSTATEGSVALVCVAGETRVVNPVAASAGWLDISAGTRAAARPIHRFIAFAPSLPLCGCGLGRLSESRPLHGLRLVAFDLLQLNASRQQITG